MIRGMPVRLALAPLVVLCLPVGTTAFQASAGDAATQRILILHQERPTVPMAELNTGFVRAIRTDPAVHREVFIEYLDHSRSADTALQNAQLRFLKLKYRKQPIDVAVAIGAVPHRILSDSALTIAPGARLLFWVNDAIAAPQIDKSTAAGGILTRYDVAGTARDILTLLPNTRKLLVVSGVTKLDSLALLHGMSELRGFGSLVDIERMVGATQQEFLERAANLPPNSAILLLNFIGDSLGTRYMPGDVTASAARIANAPIFAVTRALLGSGVVGGRMLDHEEHGRRLGELALSVLNGQPPPDAVRTLASHRPVFDARELRRWQIPEKALPADAEVFYRNQIPWDQYRRRIIAVMTLCLLEAVLIGGMLLQRRRRARAERLLADRLHFETVLADASRTFTDVHPAHLSTETTRWLRRLCTMAGARQAAILLFERDGVHLRRAESWRGNGAADNVTRRIDVDALIALKSGHVTTVRLIDHRRSPVLVLVPIGIGGRTFGVLLVEATSTRLFGESVPLDRSRVLGEIVAGAIARKNAAEELARQADALRASHVEYRRLADSLVEAQENERRRIARELHDDIAQRLTLLSLEAGEIGRDAGEAAIVPRSAIEHLTSELGTLVADMSRVSHRLHPSALEKMGLSAAIRALAGDLAACCRTQISFEEDNKPLNLSPADALTLYRVAQEALRNAVRHSGATSIVVRLTQANDVATLEVMDNGKGLDVERVRRAPGLGITSMAERVQVLGGSFSIQSRSDAGTVVRASVRLASEAKPFNQGGSIEATLR